MSSKKEKPAERRPNPGHFKKGHDARRHQFTPEECSAGFWAGLASYVEKGGNPRNFLKNKMEARGQTYNPTPKALRGRIDQERRAA